MSEKKFKMYRKVGRDIVDSNATSIVKLYLERLCKLPLRRRIAFTWAILRKRNPHNGEKVG